MEIRTASEFEKLISGFSVSISRAVAEDKNELAKLLRAMLKNIIDNSVQKRVNSEKRIYIPIDWACECGFCDKSSTVVCCEIDEGVVRIVPAHKYDDYLANRKIDGCGKTR